MISQNKIYSTFFFVILFSLPAIDYAQVTVDPENIGDRLIIGEIATGVEVLNPILYTLPTEKRIANFIFGKGLMTIDNDANIDAGIARSFQVSRDRLEWTFLIGNDIYFHDGEQLDAEDLIFTYKLYRDAQDVLYRYDLKFEKIRELKEIGPFQIKFTLNSSVDDFLKSIATLSILPKHHYNRPTLKETLKALVEERPIGSGPFKFVRFESKKGLILNANENYYLGRPFLNGITYLFFPTEDALIAELVRGKIDLANVDLQDFESAEKIINENPYVKIYRSNPPPNQCTLIGVNNLHPLFKNRSIRQALHFAINKQEIVDRLLLRQGHIAYGPLDVSSWAFYDGLQQYTFAPKKAVRLLRQNGWKDRDGDGLLDFGGRSFSFILFFEAGSNRYEEIARVVKLNLGEIGINVIPQAMETKELIQKLKNHDYHAVLYKIVFEESINQFYEQFHSSSILRKTNFLNYKNRNVDRQIDLARRIQDPQTLRPIFHRLQALITEDSPAIFLFFLDKTYFVLDNRFRNSRYTNSLTRFRPIEEWYVPKAFHKYER